MEDLKTKVVQHLQNGPDSARRIANILKVSKQQINRLLYSEHQTFHRLEGTPPQWHVRQPCEEEEEKKEEKTVYVLVDLGHVHDVLPAIQAYKTEVDIRGYADVHYKCPTFSGVTIYRAATSHKNAADLLLLRDFILLQETSPSLITIHVCSRDKIFEALAELIHEPHVFVRHTEGWESLKHFIE